MSNEQKPDPINASMQANQRQMLRTDISNIKSEPTNIGHWRQAIDTLYRRCPDLDWKGIRPMVEELEQLAGACARKDRMELGGRALQALGLIIRFKNCSIEAREHAKRLEQDSLRYYLTPKDIDDIATWYFKEVISNKQQSIENWIELESATRLWLSNGQLEMATRVFHHLSVSLEKCKNDPDMSNRLKTPEFGVVQFDADTLKSLIIIEQTPKNFNPGGYSFRLN